MARYWIVTHYTGAHSIQLREYFDAVNTDEAVSVFDREVAEATRGPGYGRDRIALVCRGEVLREWDSIGVIDQRANAGL